MYIKQNGPAYFFVKSPDEVFFFSKGFVKNFIPLFLQAVALGKTADTFVTQSETPSRVKHTTKRRHEELALWHYKKTV